ncbi:HMG box protein [Seiridium cupressi]
MSFDPDNGQAGYAQLEGDMSLDDWERLKIQLSPYNHVIAIEDRVYNDWAQETRDAILQLFMINTGRLDARFVRDSAGGRVFLGATQHLSTREAAIVEIPGYDLPIMLPRTNLWASEQNTLQGQQYPAMPAQYGAPPLFDMGMPMTFSGPAAPAAPETSEHETPTKPASSRKRKTPAKTPSSRKRGARKDDDDADYYNGPSGGGAGSEGLGINFVQLPELNLGAAIGGISHDSKYRKGEYRSGAPRPQNAFILFRSSKCKEVKQQNPNLENKELSKLIGTMWRELPDSEKQIWKHRQEQARKEHEFLYPGYKYDPKRKPVARAELPASLEALLNWKPDYLF